MLEARKPRMDLLPCVPVSLANHRAPRLPIFSRSRAQWRQRDHGAIGAPRPPSGILFSTCECAPPDLGRSFELGRAPIAEYDGGIVKKASDGRHQTPAARCRTYNIGEVRPSTRRGRRVGSAAQHLAWRGIADGGAVPNKLARPLANVAVVTRMRGVARGASICVM